MQIVWHAKLVLRAGGPIVFQFTLSTTLLPASSSLLLLYIYLVRETAMGLIYICSFNYSMRRGGGGWLKLPLKRSHFLFFYFEWKIFLIWRQKGSFFSFLLISCASPFLSHTHTHGSLRCWPLVVAEFLLLIFNTRPCDASIPRSSSSGFFCLFLLFLFLLHTPFSLLLCAISSTLSLSLTEPVV